VPLTLTVSGLDGSTKTPAPAGVSLLRRGRYHCVMHSLIADKLPQIAALCRRYDVLRLHVFGSAARDDFDPESSDIDFLVRFRHAAFGGRFEQYAGLLLELQRLLNRRVDLVEEGCITNVYVRRTIDEDRKQVYVAA
jgi:predicted nucleotidyltransferase